MGGIISAGFGLAGDAVQLTNSRQNRIAGNAAFAQAKGWETNDAVDALRRGALAAGLQRMKGSQVVARQRVGYAASGVDSTVGTPADVASGTEAFNEFDALTIENNAAREALGHKRTVQQLDQKQKQFNRDADAKDLSIGLDVAGNTTKAILSLATFGLM